MSYLTLLAGSNLVNQVKIVQEDALPPLLRLMKSPDVPVVEQAVGCMRNLSVNAGMLTYADACCRMHAQSVLSVNSGNEIKFVASKVC